MPLNTLINAVKRWALDTFSTGADWDEGKPSNAAYIANKPFYTQHIGAKTLLDASIATSGSGSGGVHSNALERVGIEAGVEYKVVFDGATYELAARASQDRNGVELGSWSIYCSDGIPFFYAEDADRDSAWLYSNSGGTHKLVIVDSGERVVRIDPKYLPDEAYSPTVFALTETSSGMTASMAVADVFDLVKNNRSVTVIEPWEVPVPITEADFTNKGGKQVSGTLVIDGYRSYEVQGYVDTDGSDVWEVTRESLALDSDLTSLATRVDALEGAGGGETSGTLIVAATVNDDDSVSVERTTAEILEAVKGGRDVVLRLGRWLGTGDECYSDYRLSLCDAVEALFERHTYIGTTVEFDHISVARSGAVTRKTGSITDVS